MSDNVLLLKIKDIKCPYVMKRHIILSKQQINSSLSFYNIQGSNIYSHKFTASKVIYCKFYVGSDKVLPSFLLYGNHNIITVYII